MNNPTENATPRQTFCLWCATGKDYRAANLTKEIASGLIAAIQGVKGDKVAARAIVDDLLAGKTVNTAAPAIPVESKEDKFRALWDKAMAAGMAAANACNPVPMVVGSPSTPFGNDIDPEKETYFVPDGVCGFAWVTVRPGNSPFANWLKKNGLARKDSYAGGVSIWIAEHGQSLQRKEAHAFAMARELSIAGIKAYGNSRID